MLQVLQSPQSADALQDIEDWVSSPGAGFPAATAAPGVAELVDRLLLSLENILTPANGNRRQSSTHTAAGTPAQRLKYIAQRVEGLPPPARLVMQRVLDEITVQLAEIRRVGGALQNAMQRSDTARRNAEQCSMTDPLTGLLNRRGFDQYAARAFSEARAQCKPVLLLFVDIDYMKQINDQGGHAAGDKAVLAAAEALRRSFRAVDVLARWGGDEFAVLSVANPLSISAAAERVQLQAERVVAEQALGFPVRLSVGAVLQEGATWVSLDDFIRQADQVMYQVKQARPRVGRL